VVNGTLPGIPTEFFDLDFIGSTVSFALASQKANPINFSGLLRARRERPRGCRPSYHFDEVAPSHTAPLGLRTTLILFKVRPSRHHGVECCL
jgi:hypothetical protein